VKISIKRLYRSFASRACSSLSLSSAMNSRSFGANRGAVGSSTGSRVTGGQGGRASGIRKPNAHVSEV
jgi:hypothetical protein